MKNQLFGPGFAAAGRYLASRLSGQWQLQFFALLFAVIVLALSPVNLEAQRAKHAPITTRWAKDVDITNPLPQMVRKDWLSLNGVWQFQSGLANEPIPASPLRSKIVVPFPVESLLS